MSWFETNNIDARNATARNVIRRKQTRLPVPYIYIYIYVCWYTAAVAHAISVAKNRFASARITCIQLDFPAAFAKSVEPRNVGTTSITVQRDTYGGSSFVCGYVLRDRLVTLSERKRSRNADANYFFPLGQVEFDFENALSPIRRTSRAVTVPGRFELLTARACR